MPLYEINNIWKCYVALDTCRVNLLSIIGRFLNKKISDNILQTASYNFQTTNENYGRSKVVNSLAIPLAFFLSYGVLRAYSNAAITPMNPITSVTYMNFTRNKQHGSLCMNDDPLWKVVRGMRSDRWLWWWLWFKSPRETLRNNFVNYECTLIRNVIEFILSQINIAFGTNT